MVDHGSIIGVNRTSADKMNEELVIRAVGKSDAFTVFNWRNHSNVRKWSHDTDLIDIESHLGWFLDWVEQQDAKGYFFIVELRNTCVGLVRFDHISEARFEISVIVDPDYQGRGIARSAITKALAHLEKSHGVFTIIASIHRDNLVSIKLFQNLNFIQIGSKDKFIHLVRKFGGHNA